MDSYRIFVEMFKQAASARDFGTLPSIFKDGHGFLAIVSLEHRGKCRLILKNMMYDNS